MADITLHSHTADDMEEINVTVYVNDNTEEGFKKRIGNVHSTADELIEWVTGAVIEALAGATVSPLSGHVNTVVPWNLTQNPENPSHVQGVFTQGNSEITVNVRLFCGPTGRNSLTSSMIGETVEVYLMNPDDPWVHGSHTANFWLSHFFLNISHIELISNPAILYVKGTSQCFMHGTIFRTLKDNTDVPIEIQNLKVGDLVKTEVFVNQEQCKFSQEGWQRIKRMVQRPLTSDEYAEKTVILPKDAFGEGKPDKDLHVTWGHGLLLKEMKDEWKNEEYNGDHVTYSKSHALVKGDFIKLLAGHCSLCRKPNEEEKKKASEEQMRSVYYHLEIEDKEEKISARTSDARTDK